MARAIRVPSTVATTVESTPTWSEVTREEHAPDTRQGSCQCFQVKPCHTMLVLPWSLKEKANV